MAKIVHEIKPTIAQARPIAVAKEVQAQVLAGRKPNVSEAARKNGYKPSSIKAGKVQRSPAFKREMASFADRLEKHREKILTRMEKTIGKARYRDAAVGLDRTTKVHQLLTGGATEHIAMGVRRLSDKELEQLAEGHE